MDKGLKQLTAKPLDCFPKALNVLTAAGYTKLFQPRNQCTKVCHQIYRVVVILFIITYNIQHFVYIYQISSNIDDVIAAVILLIPIVVLAVKVFVMYFATEKIDRFIDLLADPIFGARNLQDEQFMIVNKKNMYRLLDVSNIGLSSVCALWLIEPIVNRITDENTKPPLYVPFHTKTWPRYIIAILWDRAPVLWLGYGNFNIDCFISILFSQAQVQLKIIRYNLEHLFDADTPRERSSFKYLDAVDETIQKRFVHYVQRYEKVVWFTSEMTSSFGLAISAQFFMSSLSTCLIVYMASSISPASVQFIFYAGCYLAIQFQNLIYCYYGGMVEYESKYVSDSLYLGEWLSLSPPFRRQLLIAMARWIRPITPRVSGIIPLSLSTFMTITRSAYTLYTVLKSKKNREEGGQRTLAF